jgi:hypothetical protein
MNEFKPVVLNDKIGYIVHDKVDLGITKGYTTAFSYFKYFDSGHISKESLETNVNLNICCGKFSYAEIPRMFTSIIGVSGTLESLTEKEKEIIAQYGISKIACAPSIYGPPRRSFTDVHVVSRSDWFLRIVQHAQDKVKAKRAVIIFFDNEMILGEFEKTYRHSFQKYQSLTETSSDQNDIVIKATVSGMTSCCTRIFGRGVDFICLDDVTRSQGGVHVIQTFMAKSDAEFTQIQGRTARQGDPGSFELILCAEDLEDSFYLTADEISKHQTSGTLFKKLNELKDQLYADEVNSLTEKAASVRAAHLRSKKYYKALGSYSGSPEQRKTIENMIVSMNSLGYSAGKFSKFHIYFLLDDSGSMIGTPWKELLAAVKGFVDKRIRLCTENGLKPEDLFTIINHSSNSKVMCRSEPITSDPSTLTKFRGGGNNFCVAFNTAYAELQNLQEGFVPVLLFMTDGGCKGGEEQLQQIARDFASANIQIYVVGFSQYCNKKKLEDMASLVSGQYFFGTSGSDLLLGFENISSNLNTVTFHL